MSKRRASSEMLFLDTLQSARLLRGKLVMGSGSSRRKRKSFREVGYSDLHDLTLNVSWTIETPRHDLRWFGRDSIQILSQHHIDVTPLHLSSLPRCMFRKISCCRRDHHGPLDPLIRNMHSSPHVDEDAQVHRPLPSFGTMPRP